MIYQLKVAINDTNPLVWRTVQVKSDITFLELHMTIQLAMGWENSHLFDFILGNYTIGMPDDFFENEDGRKLNAEEEILAKHINKRGANFSYLYDFGDDWSHTITLQNTQSPQSKQVYPLCIDGANNCPLEDSGGIYGFYEKLNILKNPKHPEYEDVLEWVGEDYNIIDFDIITTNKQLKKTARYLKEMKE